MPSPTSVNRRTLLSLLGGSIAARLRGAAYRARAGGLADAAGALRQRLSGWGRETDTLSRILCQKMSELSGQSFVVENRAGAGGVLGVRCGRESGAGRIHGWTWRHASNVLAIGSYAKLPYDPRP